MANFNDNSRFIGRDSGFSGFTAIQTPISPVLMTITFARDVKDPRMVRLNRIIRLKKLLLPESRLKNCEAS